MVQTTTLGGTAANVVVCKVAHGLMTMTMNGNISDEQAFEAIKNGIDALPAGTKMMLNSADFYGQGHSLGNLELLARFFEKYPGYAEKTFLSVKGTPWGHEGKTLEEGIRSSVDRSIEALRGTKKIDLFQRARIDKGATVEDVVNILVTLVKEGKFDHIGLSECRAETLRRGHAIHPISVVEIEVSPISYEQETKDVLAAAAELDICVAAYSPLGHGMVTGAVKSIEDIPDDTLFKKLDRFKEENWQYNRRLVDALVALAAKKGCTPAQLSIAWVCALGAKVIPIPSATKKERILENVAASDIELSSDDMAEMEKILETNPVHGHRYFGPQVDAMLWQ